jgi:hypothetical protein
MLRETVAGDAIIPGKNADDALWLLRHSYNVQTQFGSSSKLQAREEYASMRQHADAVSGKSHYRKECTVVQAGRVHGEHLYGHDGACP